MKKTIYREICTSKKSRDEWNVYLEITYDEETEEYEIAINGNSGKVNWTSKPFRKYVFTVLNKEELLNQDDELHDERYNINETIKKVLPPDKQEADTWEEEKDKDEEQETAVSTIPNKKAKKKKPFEKKELQVKIHELFKNEVTETTQGYKMDCPDCGPQGGRTEGFILFPESNTAFCHTSNKWFTMLEAYALKKNIIRCLDGNEKGEEKRKVLGGELFTLVLEEFKNEFGTDMYNKLNADLNIRRSIELPGNNRKVSAFCDELGDIYKSRNVLFFRGELREIVEIHRYKKIGGGKEYVENGFKSVESNRFVTLAEMFIDPWTIVFTKSGNSMTVTKSMTQSTASISLASPNLQDKLPPITRIFDIQIPILHEGKLTFPKKGYDVRFGSWLPYNAPQIKEGMFTVEDAKNMIDEIFSEFCFASEKDRIHAIAAFITPFLRGLFPTFSTRTPVFIYMANRERAGKDYCAGCSGVLYEGVNIEEPAMSNDEKGGGNNNEEIRKKIMACMIQGKKRFHSANNKGLLNNSILEGVTTSETWSDRILGKSENVTFSNEMDFSLSGNLGIRLTPDLANRARIVNLHLVDEDANGRKFKNPKLHEWIVKNRSVIISALYSLVRKWMDDGMPPGTLPFTSFPQWAAICGGIMESAGYENPCEPDKSAIISLDSETEEMKQLYESCYLHHPEEWLTKQEIRALAVSEGIMADVDFNQVSEQTKFGQKIDKYVNRIMSGILMTVENLEQRASRRRYKFTKNLTVFGTQNFSPKSNKNDEKVEQPVININRKTDKVDHNIDKKFENNTLKVGNHGNSGNPAPLPIYPFIKQHTADTETLPKPPRLPDSAKQPNLEILPKKFGNLEDYSKKAEDFNKKEEGPKKEKTDRELQFYESPETSDMVEKCTKNQTLEWVKNNPGKSYKTMYFELGDGCFKHLEELLATGFLKGLNDGWEVI
jgi:hypothetical protein